ncbi:MAG TPA: hypothetical protein VF607_11600 [Verrucomicrobiae bacterium]
MIHRHEVLPMLAEACSSYQPAPGEADLLYVALGDFAEHLWELHRAGRTDDFPAIAKVIEWLRLDGDHYVREALAVGLLAGIDFEWTRRGTDPEWFFCYLFPQTAHWWRTRSTPWTNRYGPNTEAGYVLPSLYSAQPRPLSQKLRD